jgi:hypothetical protein
MIPRAAGRVLGVICGVLLPLCASAKDKPPAFHVASIAYRQGGKLDGGILQSCDVAKLVTGAIQEQKLAKGTPTELVLRIDRVMKLRGRPPPRPAVAGTELGITLLAVGPKQLDQPFLCRKDGLIGTSDASHCARVAKCSRTIAEQMSTWLSGS